MIQIIKMFREGKVSIRITIKGAILWSYDYLNKDTHIIEDSENAGSDPNVHDLGFPDQLHRNLHSWSIELINHSSKVQPYEVLIEWLQDGEVISQWPQTDERSGDLHPDDEPIKILGGNAKLVIKA